MVVTQPADDVFEFRHDGIAAARPMVWIVAACVGAVALAMLWGGSWISLILALAVGGGLVWLLRRSSADSLAVFDRAEGTVRITHSRNGRQVESEELPLAAVSAVIVDAAGRSRRHDNVLQLRPALVVDAAIVPLTWRAFVSGDTPVDCALEIRRFLGHPVADLYRDSVAALARHTDRVNPAVRIARLGMGLSRIEAAELVTRLRGGS